VIKATEPVAVVPGRTGIFGGTFDPIHHGHLAIAEAAREVLGLERVLFVPSNRPPHRPDPPVAGAEDRARMVELAIAGNPRFGLSRIELDRAGPSFSVDTIEAQTAEDHASGREPDLWFILSAEAFAGFPQWERPDRILALCRLAILPRDGQAGASVAGVLGALSPQMADRIVVLDGPRIRLSATDIRARARLGLSVRYLVPDAVAGYIVDHRLYRDVVPASTTVSGGQIAE
jgi:nicotinate-nucleotide adenylyltransferase